MARRILSSSQSGAPGASVPRMNWPLKPIRFFKQRNIARKMVSDPASGLTSPEFKNLIGGVALKTRNVTRKLQTPLTPPAPNAGQIKVRPRAKRVVKR